MKTIAYSEVPANPQSYVHLAYLSASSGPAEAMLPVALLGAIAYLLVYSVGAATKLTLKSPRIWRVMTLTVVTATGFLVLLSILAGG